jgi:histidyl-tRNA synthetase
MRTPGRTAFRLPCGLPHPGNRFHVPGSTFHGADIRAAVSTFHRGTWNLERGTDLEDSMPEYTAPRGTTDVLPDEQRYWRFVRSTADPLAERFGYQWIDIPMFEDAGVFERGVGEGTDIVEKEMFLLQPRSEEARRYALRPEPTAGICRAYVERGMASLPSPQRFYFVGPLFRYERPQAGRLRQFTQIDLEAIGSDDPALDAEVILYTWRLLDALGLRDLTLLVNSIGDREARAPYLEALKDYFRPHLEQLDADDQMRFERNPLRILDSKNERTRELLAGAPSLHEWLPGPSLEHFERLQAHLRAAAIPFTIEPRLVRGFDYYTHTVFEVVPPNATAQGTIGGGGRYDGLIELFGGRPTPAVGVGIGMERIVLNLMRQEIAAPPPPGPRVFVATASAAAAPAAFALADELRSAGLSAQLGTGTSLRSQLRHAGRLGATYAAIIGDDELAEGIVTLRKMSGGEQRSVPRAAVVREVRDGDAPSPVPSPTA